MVVEDNVMYIHGGRADLIFDDMYVMSTVNFIWIKVAVLVFAMFLQIWYVQQIYAHEEDIWNYIFNYCLHDADLKQICNV